MPSIKLDVTPSKEFFSDVLITAFDGQFGGAWEWFEPAPNESTGWLERENSEETWLKAKIKLRDEYIEAPPKTRPWDALVRSLAGNAMEIDHDNIAEAIQRIVDDEYIGVWRPATIHEEDDIDQDRSSRKWRAVATDHGTGYEVHTGETANGYRQDILQAVTEEDAGMIDSAMADCIIQVAVFGKVIFG